MKEYLILVMAKEKEAIENMIESLDYEEVEKAVEVIEKREGKLIFMGVGKSGHVAEKLAATFSSLGISSFYVHGTESCHGDLGMVEKRDVVVLCSNSGSTKEILQNLAPLRNIGAKLIAFTGKKDSPLYKECDAALVYPYINEADDLGLAPTSSSTMELVLGDAVACYLSHKKGFKKEDFFKYHPNGALGESLKKELKK